MEYIKAKKYFYSVVGFWYFTYFSMIYSQFPLDMDSPNSITIGRITTAIDSFVMLVVFSLFGVVLVQSLKSKDYKTALLSIFLIIWPLFWAFATIDDTFGTNTVTRFV
jgi:hypothetical protein